ncbi:angiogenic factor with G patch and FHA domains 1 isoform X2, partial [Paramuricea clavata]
KTRLYYDYRTGIYYTYNQERGSYDFYSQVAVSTTPNTDTTGQTSSGGGSEKRSEETKTKELPEKSKVKVTHIELVESGSEDGEIVEVDEVDSETQGDDDELKEKEYPPCIRATVMQSDKLPVGSLTIITCMGLTFGRIETSNNNLQISDIEVSKEHAKVYYDDKSSEYFVKDLGSQNGTFINGSRISESKQESEGHKLSHGEQLKIGSTTFLLHIHPGSETCDECEPGQVQAQLKAKEMEDEVLITRVVSSVNDGNPESLRKKELKRLKKRYMLENSEHEVNSEVASINAGKYKDRAQTRRVKVGSEAPNSDVAASPASVFKPIKSENKGRMMLEKMGWVDGQGLGKSKTGRTEPVLATIRETGRGLGYGAVKSIDMPHKNSKSFKWKKTQDRYNAIGRGQTATSSQGSVSINWVKKTSKPETLDIFADDT